MNIILCSFPDHIFVSSGWLLNLKTKRSIRSPPLQLITPRVCNYDAINYCNTVFLFSACGCVRKKTFIIMIIINNCCLFFTIWAVYFFALRTKNVEKQKIFIYIFSFSSFHVRNAGEVKRPGS